VLHGQHDLFGQNGLRDASQASDQLLGFLLGQSCQTAADTAVIRPGCLPPGSGHRVVLIDRVCRAAQILEML